jgi:NAD(P)-dependent dehydrogenase (short-subunit alcohol dehydrogenase family)
MTTTLPPTIKALIPVGRMGVPSEIAEAIAFLASETAVSSPVRFST